MGTEIVKKIGPGRDYPTLAAWQTAYGGTSGNLVANNQVAVAECYPMEDTQPVTISGWTTDAAHGIVIRTPQAYRHHGQWSTDAYRLVVLDSSALSASQDFVRVEGLQIALSSTNAWRYALLSTGQNNVVVGNIIRALIVRDSCYGISTSSKTIACNVVYGFATGPGNRGISCSHTTMQYVYGNTVYGCSVGIALSSYLKQDLKNNIIAQCSTCYSGVGNCTVSSTHNVSSDATAPQRGICYANTNVAFADPANGDFHVLPADAIAGADLSSTFSTDIDGQPITVWSAGADAQAGPATAAAQDVSHTASGGAVSGGSALAVAQVAAAGSGGAVATGSSATLCQAVHAARGGAAVSGAVGVFAGVAVIAAGGAVLSGAAVQFAVRVHAATGGATCDGWAVCETATATGQPQRADIIRLTGVAVPVVRLSGVAANRVSLGRATIRGT